MMSIFPFKLSTKLFWVESNLFKFAISSVVSASTIAVCSFVISIAFSNSSFLLLNLDINFDTDL